MKNRGGIQSMRAAILLVAGWAAGAFAQEAPPRATPERPTLGIIATDKEAEPLADLLTAKLSTSGLVQLVEREQMAAIMQELQLAIIQKSDSIAIGRMTRASALLFIDMANDAVRIRISETQRGELLFQQLFPDSDLSAVCDMVVQHFPALASKLTFSGQRIYIAVRPVQMSGASRADVGILDRFRYLLEARLFCGDDVVLVERESLGDLSLEREAMEATDDSQLSAADYVIRMAAEKSEAEEYSISVRAMSTNGKDSALLSDHFDRLTMEDAVARLGTDVLKYAGQTRVDSTAHLAAEAILQRNVAQLLLMNHNDHFRGLPGLEVAYLLQPDNDETAELLVRHICGYLHNTANVVGSSGNRFFLKCERDDPETYMEYVRWFRMAMTVARRHPQSALYLFPDLQLNPIAFLASPPKKLSPRDKLTMDNCRAELKDFYEWYGEQPETAGHNPVVFVFPLFFSNPKDAFHYLRTSLKEPEFSSIRWCEHPFAWISYWDVSTARKLWTGFMEELISSGVRDRQFEGLACLCYDNGAFGDSLSWNLGDSTMAVSSAQRLFRWLSQDADNLVWFIQAEGGYTILRLQRALGLLPREEQDRYFRDVMLPILKAEHPNIPGAFLYPEAHQWKKSPASPLPDLAVSAPAASETVSEPDPESLADIERLRKEKWKRNLMQCRKADAESGEFWFEFGPGSKILYDSEGEEGSLGFLGSSLLVDGNMVWIGWSEKGGFGLARMDLEEMDRQPLEFHVSTDKGYGSSINPLRLARWRDYLVLAGASGVVAIPLDTSGLPRVLEKREQGPQIGDAMMGHHATGNSAMEYENRCVSALVPGPDGIYVCLYDGNSGIYMWNPDETNVQKICSSDSLSSGPLNDCLPYHVFAGCLSPGGKEMYFFIAGKTSQPTDYASGQRFGVWKYAPAHNLWTQVSSNDFGNAHGGALTPTLFGEDTMLVGTAEAIYGFNTVAENLSQLFHRAGRLIPGLSGGWELKRDDVTHLEFAQPCAILEKGAPKFSFNPKKLWFQTAVPTSHGLLVMLSGISGRLDGILGLLPGEEK